MNLKLSPSRPGLLSLQQLHTTLLTSSSWKHSTSMSLCWLQMVWNQIPSNLGLLKCDSWKRYIKNLLSSSLTIFGSSLQAPSIITPCRPLFLRLALIRRWKYPELQSPSLIHLDLAFYLSSDSCAWAASHRFCCICFLASNCQLVSCLSSNTSSSCLSLPQSSYTSWEYL